MAAMTLNRVRKNLSRRPSELGRRQKHNNNLIMLMTENIPDGPARLRPKKVVDTQLYTDVHSDLDYSAPMKSVGIGALVEHEPPTSLSSLLADVSAPNDMPLQAGSGFSILGDIAESIKVRKTASYVSESHMQIVGMPPGIRRALNQKNEENAMIANPELCAARILKDVGVLRSADPSLFIKIAKDITQQAEDVSVTMLGGNHPLASLLSTPFNDPVFDRIIANVNEYRRRQHETGE
jgi:hypothetical protein